MFRYVPDHPRNDDHMRSPSQDQDAFAMADVDQDGFVSRSEFQNFVNDCPGNFSKDQLHKLFDSQNFEVFLLLSVDHGVQYSQNSRLR